MSKLEIQIDGNLIKSEQDFHVAIAKLLEFPEWYGKNLDALWDLLTGHVETDVQLTWSNHQISKENLGEDFKAIISVFEDLKESYPEFELILE